jgi:hypothetical protein
MSGMWKEFGTAEGWGSKYPETGHTYAPTDPDAIWIAFEDGVHGGGSYTIHPNNLERRVNAFISKVGDKWEIIKSNNAVAGYFEVVQQLDDGIHEDSGLNVKRFLMRPEKRHWDFLSPRKLAKFM